MSRIKSNTLPHSLYRELKDEIDRHERHVLTVDASMRQRDAIHRDNLEQLRHEAATTRESLDAAEAQIASLLEEHAVRDAAEEELRENCRKAQSAVKYLTDLSDHLETRLRMAQSAARYSAELSDHLETRLHMAYTTLAVIGAVAAFTAVISAVHHLPKVL